MGKLQLASRLADEAGVSLSKASKFVDDIGAGRARNAADELATRGSETLSSNWFKAGAATTVVGGGALAWRQQDINQARQIANQQKSQQSAIADIMDSSMSPEAKQELVDQLLEAQNQNNNDGGDGGNPLDGIFPDLDMTGIQITIGLVVVLALLVTLGGGD